MTAKTTIGEEAPRPIPPLVYRDASNGDRWLVEPPVADDGAEATAFTGPNAFRAALEYAHRTYGCARYLAG